MLPLAACSSPLTAQNEGEKDLGLALSAQAARDSTALLARYSATAAAHPQFTAQLNPLRAQVSRHIEAFTVLGVPGPSVSASAATRQVPAEGGQALAALAAAEQRLSDARSAALQDASPGLACLLASAAAAGACHVLLLQGLW
jgi:hypothetical protein